MAIQEKTDPMQIVVFKGLYKPMYWGGLPRALFIALLAITAFAVIVFKSPYAVFPIAVVYGICVAVCRVDQHLLKIILYNWRMKDVYFPD